MRIIGQTIRVMPEVKTQMLEIIDNALGGLELKALGDESWHLEFVDFFNAYSKFFDFYLREHPTV